MTNQKVLPKLLLYFGVGSATFLSLFHLYTALMGIFKTSMIHYAVHLLFVFIIFITVKKPLYKTRYSLIWLDFLLIILSIYALAYVIFNYVGIVSIMDPNALTLGQFTAAWIIFLLVLYTSFRINVVFFILSLIMITYALFGDLIPGPFQHAGLNLNRLVYMISFTSDGVFGTILGVSATYLFIFIFFGVVLEKTGTGDFIIRFSQGLVGKYTGGTAKTALVASAGLGSVVGSSVGNVVATGSLTIPIMKKTGFKPRVAAAIEAVASEGGQLLPPVLGAGAFIMAQMTGIPYTTIALAATIPAILYFVSIFFVIDFEARKNNIKGLAKDQIPKLKEVILDKGHLFFSLFVLFYLLIFVDMGVMKAGFYTVFAAIALSMFRKSTRLKWKDLFDILKSGGEAAVEIALICATMGIVAGVVVFTGIGVRLSEIVIGLSDGNLFLTLFLAMIITIILGMGLPTPVAYMIAAIFVAPALMDVGVPQLSAHLFLFFFAIKSGSTPPVAIVAVVAAGIAKANWFKTALTATKYSIPSFIIAYMFVYSEALLFKGSLIDIIITFITALIGVAGFAGFLQRWWLRKSNWIENIIIGGGSILLIVPNIVTSSIGFVILLLITVYQYVTNKKKQAHISDAA